MPKSSSSSTSSGVLARLANHTLMLGDTPVFTDVPAQITLEADPLGTGVFLCATAEKADCTHIFPIGKPHTIHRFTSGHRYEPFWMLPHAGVRGRDVIGETQYLLAELTDGSYCVLLPILDLPFRASLRGNDDDTLLLVAETGDPVIVGDSVSALFIAVGDDPYRLMEQAARSVMARMHTGRLRREKPLPAFADRFGWCTWDSFYEDLSHEKIAEGLRSFAEGGVSPKMLILDCGWQSICRAATGERRMSAFAADAAKFPGDLAPTVQMAKQQFGIETFMVWHTIFGEWGGTDGASLPAYQIHVTTRDYSPSVADHAAEIPYFGRVAGVVAPESVHRFYGDFHRHLRLQGVDGVKIDSQSSLEAVAQSIGGRVELMRAYHEALEGSTHTHLAGNLINCMSCSSDMVYQALNSTVTRSSTDFWPLKPASHGLHVYTNAQTSLWLGEFVHPDWDMFQSGHAMGAFHAAARAVGGCPIYVSDKPDGHNFDVLRKLVLSDGSILRAQQIGRPTRDCLFNNPLEERILLKIFNLNEGAGVVGAFNVQYHEDAGEQVAITGHVSPNDVEGLAGEQFAVYAHTTQTLQICERRAELPVALPELSFEIFTIVPIADGVAPIGLTEKFNSAGAVTAKALLPGDGGYAITLRDGGLFLAWCRKAPRQVFVDEREHPFTFDSETNALRLELATGPHTVRIS